jgi:para-aminobenzoate synthetase component 1
MKIAQPTYYEFSVANPEDFKIKMLNWINQFNIFSFLDSSTFHQMHEGFCCIAAAGAKVSKSFSHNDLFVSLKEFHSNHPGWLFGHINYPQQKADNIGFPDGFFFVPEILLKLTKKSVQISSDSLSPELVFAQINAHPTTINNPSQKQVQSTSLLSKQQYIDIIHQLKDHIQRGDCYEINFCQEFFAENTMIDPLLIYHQLTTVSPNPFSAFYKINERYCICASPERFLKKSSNKVISQPIKGTSKRNLSDKQLDEASKQHLLNSPKERSENVMIVDLVRNDLSKVCTQGSVKVTELFGIYPFQQVFQMISTIEGEVDKNIHWTDIVDACFPMGSMTGAPKYKVMQLIDQYEASPRGLFSGTIGYVTPEGDFDFNVVIRSIFYHQAKQLLSYKAGGGITISSNPSAEYEESKLKASAIELILNKP